MMDLPQQDVKLQCHIERCAVEQYQVVLYYSPSCPYCRKVLNVLADMHKAVTLKNTQTSFFRNELIRIGGKKQVPCLMINGQALYESKDIISWLKKHQNQY